MHFTSFIASLPLMQAEWEPYRWTDRHADSPIAILCKFAPLQEQSNSADIYDDQKFCCQNKLNNYACIDGPCGSALVLRWLGHISLVAFAYFCQYELRYYAEVSKWCSFNDCELLVTFQFCMYTFRSCDMYHYCTFACCLLLLLAICNFVI